MSDIPSTKTRIQIEGARFNSANSESMIQGLGAAINYLNDQDTTNIANFATIHGKTFTQVYTYGATSYSGSPPTNSLVIYAGLSPSLTGTSGGGFWNAGSGAGVGLAVCGGGAVTISGVSFYLILTAAAPL